MKIVSVMILFTTMMLYAEQKEVPIQIGNSISAEQMQPGVVSPAVQVNVVVTLQKQFRGSSIQAKLGRNIIKVLLAEKGLNIIEDPFADKFGVIRGDIASSLMDDLNKVAGVEKVEIDTVPNADPLNE